MFSTPYALQRLYEVFQKDTNHIAAA